MNAVTSWYIPGIGIPGVPLLGFDEVEVPHSREEVFEAFKEAVRLVWSNADFVLPVLMISSEEPAGDVYASISYRGTPRAIGNSLIARAPMYTLRVADRLLEQDDNIIRGILIHEAVHIGHAKHTAEFRDLVRQYGGAVSELATETGGMIHIQKKIGTRYVTIRTFQPHEEREAREWGRAEVKANPGVRYRMSQ